MEYYDAQQVCLNGHQITDSYNKFPQDRKGFCDECGEKTIHTFPKCNEEIRGEYYVHGVAFIGGPSTSVPAYCHKCSAPYPWTEKKKEIEKAVVSSTPTDPICQVEDICTRFHLVAKQLRSRHDSRPTLDIADEYDVQDLIHSLLRLLFDDIRPEEWTPSYAGSSSRMDFLLKNESIVIEVKKTRIGLGTKELGDQLIVDIERYQKHPSCKTLFCFVYDPEGRIANPQGLERDLSRREDDFIVKVFIAPKGL